MEKVVLVIMHNFPWYAVDCYCKRVRKHIVVIRIHFHTIMPCAFGKYAAIHRKPGICAACFLLPPVVPKIDMSRSAGCWQIIAYIPTINRSGQTYTSFYLGDFYTVTGFQSYTPYGNGSSYRFTFRIRNLYFQSRTTLRGSGSTCNFSISRNA